MDLIRESVRVAMRKLIDASERIGAGRFERTESRVDDRESAEVLLVSG